MEGNSITGNSKIARAVEDHKSRDLTADSARVSYSWVGDEITIEVAGTNDGAQKVVSFEEETSLEWRKESIYPEFSDRAAQAFIGKTNDNIHTIAVAIVDRYWNDSEDHAAWGYWLSVNNPSRGAVDVGAFAQGAMFERDDPISNMHLARRLARQDSQVHYSREGGAVGLHVVEYVEADWSLGGKTAIAEFSADVWLTADFRNAPMLRGHIYNFQYNEPYEETLAEGALFASADAYDFFANDRPDHGKRPYVIDFSSKIDSDGTFSTEDVDMEKAGRNHVISGSVRPRFVDCCLSLESGNTVGVASGKLSVDLGRIGGTFRTKSVFPNGTVGQYLGAFVVDENSRPRAPLRVR